MNDFVTYMESIFIFKELKAEFSKYVDENNQLNDIKAQMASWKFGIYPSTSQIFEIHTCRSEDNCFHNLEFHEYCLLIATIKNEVYKSDGKPKFKITRPKTMDTNKSRWDVFLGGACNPTTWRLDVAIPFLKEKNITFYNPQVQQWDPSLIEIEEMAKQEAKVQLFVLDIKRTRGIAGLVEASYLAGQGRNLILVVPAERPVTMKEIEVTEIDEKEFQSINRSYLFIADLVQRQGIPLFTSVTDALKATRVSLISNQMVQDLTEIDGVVPVKHSYVNVWSMVRAIHNTFLELDGSRSGLITLADVQRGLSQLFGCRVIPISLSKETFTYPDFCIEFSILLLLSIQQHREMIRSQSVVNCNIRSTSLENISCRDNTDSLKSAINIKDRLSSHEEDRQSAVTVQKKEVGKSSRCRCLNQSTKLSSCITRIIKWPFSRISIVRNSSPDQRDCRLPIQLVPQPVIEDETYDIFLGGTCGESDWRERIAIPRLTKAGCTYYDPQITNSLWSRRMLPREARAREQSRVLVYIITGECTSTAALVEAAHFIGQGKKLLLHVDFLPSMCSPPLTPMGQLLQSSCSFPFSSLNPSDKAQFFQPNNSTDSNTTGYYSNSDTSESGILTSNNQFSLPCFSNKLLSVSDAGHIRSIEDLPDLGLSFTNISRLNPLPSIACKDHNRGRKYLLDLARRAKVQILSSIEETIEQAIIWSQKPSLSHGWVKKSSS